MTDVSLLLLTFNQETMVRAAALACLAQEGGPYEIVFSDDASTDGTFAVLEAVASEYRGPHRLVVRRNPVNLGIGEHYNQLIGAATGELMVTAAGDDISVPHRVARLAAAWDANGRRADLISSHLVDFDHDGQLHGEIRVDDLGQWHGLEDWLKQRPYIIGASHAFTRRMMKRFGRFHSGIAYEDQIMAFRALVTGGGLTVNEPLVHYRRGGTSRIPKFDDAMQMMRWRNRQSDREWAEAMQLVADGDVIGIGDQVRHLLRWQIGREGFKRNIREAPDWQARWRLFSQAPELPFWWRLRKMLHVLFPVASFLVKNRASKFHRRNRV